MVRLQKRRGGQELTQITDKKPHFRPISIKIRNQPPVHLFQSFKKYTKKNTRNEEALLGSNDIKSTNLHVQLIKNNKKQ